MPQTSRTTHQNDGSPVKSIADVESHNTALLIEFNEWKKEQAERDAAWTKADAMLRGIICTTLFLFAILILCVPFSRPEFQTATVKIIGEHAWVLGVLAFSACTAVLYVVGQFNKINDQFMEQSQQFKEQSQRFNERFDGLQEEIRHIGDRTNKSYDSNQRRVDTLYHHRIETVPTQSGG